MLTIKSLNIQNFKGLKSFEFNPNSKDATISGQNGTGKTTVFDAFLWLLFGKDSTGRKDFGVRPLDLDNKPVKGVVTSVMGKLVFDGDMIVFRKDLQEKVVKGQSRGYETVCWIDDVPKKVGEFSDTIADLIDEHVFKMLTDLHFFNEKLHWTDRREILMKLAGDIQPGEQFKSLLDVLSGRTVDEYKKVIADKKKGYVKERDEINPRIDEQNGILEKYAEEKDDARLIQQRMLLTGDLDTLDAERKTLLTSEGERSSQLDAINTLKAKRAERESAIKNDTAGHRPLFEEKSKIEAGLESKKFCVKQCENTLLSLTADINTRKTMLETCQADLNTIRGKYLVMQDVDFSDSKCSACGQTLPQDKIEPLVNENKLKMKHLAGQGNLKKAEKRNTEKLIDEAKEKLTEAQDELDKAKIELTEAQTYATERLTQISEQLNNRVVVKPEDDPMCKQLDSDIAEAEKAILGGASLSDKFSNIEIQIREKTEIIARIDKSLAGVDIKEKASKRIEELKLREKELSEKIAELDGTLNQIGDYNAYQSNQIEMAVNGKFEYVNFKLFNTLFNGSIEPCCEALLDGTGYEDCSYGEKALMGADIINVLSEYYKLNVPVFVDNQESLTVDLKLNCQQIFLKAVDSICDLQVQSSAVETKKDGLF